MATRSTVIIYAATCPAGTARRAACSAAGSRCPDPVKGSMMTTRYLTTPGSAPASGGTAPCGCGQHPCGCGQGTPPPCCDCECDTGCLSRPHFYCGMVLTDDQLNDLAQWVRRRSALHRYVEGWGVVRGLGIRCDPAGPGCVVVGPGYARSCCG